MSAVQIFEQVINYNIYNYVNQKEDSYGNQREDNSIRK